ncbi:MAG: ABC transporter ATP-binding protein [Pseudomonadota bacterium]
MALLSLTGVSKRFGALVVADDLTFSVEEGEALGVIGPNGAGKTTMFNLVSGALKANAGTVMFRGRDVTVVPADVRCRLGIGRTFQVPHPFEGMTVFENALVGAFFGGGTGADDPEETAFAALSLAGLDARANQLAGALPLLERKRLELARALASSPKLLLLDEIAGGLTEAECGALIASIKAIRASGISIVWIEHVVHALMAVVDRLIVLDQGRLVAEGAPRAVMESALVREIYMGSDPDG